jgi:cell filamentation protein
MGALIRGLAEVHVEFVLIHPFREGNGRIARLLADVMACQAGIGPLDYSEWDRQRDLYFAAIRAGAVLNVTPMADGGSVQTDVDWGDCRFLSSRSISATS